MAKQDRIRPATPATDATSTSLLEQIKARDNAAWQRLINLYGPLVFSWCQRSGMGNEVAGRAARGVCGRGGAHGRVPPPTARRYLSRLASRDRHEPHSPLPSPRGRPAQGGRRHGGPNHIQDLPESADDLEAAPDEQGYPAVFRRALEMIRCDFEPRIWQAFWITVVEGQNSTEAGDRLVMTAAAVRMAKHRVLQHLRATLGDLLE